MTKKPNEMQLSFLDSEIEAELKALDPNAKTADAVPTRNDETVQQVQQDASDDKIYDKKNNVARTPFVLHDFDAPRDKEMAVFTHAKKLSEYIFVITEKSPKKLRWSIVSRLQNVSVELIENLYRANYEVDEARADFQKRASVCLNLVDFYAETAKKMQAINTRQMFIIARQTSDISRLLKGWIRSGKRA